MNTPNKIKSRHAALKKLIAKHAIEDQETLVSLMQERYGLATSQSIISRDLRTLSIIKRNVNNKMMYELPETDTSREILRFAVLDILHNESLIVIHTLPGTAAFVADFLDIHPECDILGTIAGENIIFISPISTKKIKRIVQKLRTVLYIKSNSQKDLHE